jgi:hypothetical protein
MRGKLTCGRFGEHSTPDGIRVNIKLQWSCNSSIYHFNHIGERSCLTMTTYDNGEGCKSWPDVQQKIGLVSE